MGLQEIKHRNQVFRMLFAQVLTTIPVSSATSTSLAEISLEQNHWLKPQTDVLVTF